MRDCLSNYNGIITCTGAINGCTIHLKRMPYLSYQQCRVLADTGLEVLTLRPRTNVRSP